MTTRSFDFKTKGVRLARKTETGSKDTTFFKKVCAGCGKPFNKSKGRARTLAVTLPSNHHGFICARCQGSFAPVDPGYPAGPSKGAGLTGEKSPAFALIISNA